MFATMFWKQALIIAGVIIIFLVTSFINAKIKPKKDVELPEK